MRTGAIITFGACLFAMVLAKTIGKGTDHFDPNSPHCRGHGYYKDGKCHCYPRFSGELCEQFLARECTKDGDCGSEYAYCMHKLSQCRHSLHCRDPSGWCVPLDPAVIKHGRV